MSSLALSATTTPVSTYASLETTVKGPNQIAFETHGTDTVNVIVAEALSTLVTSRQMAWPDFKAKHIDSKQAAISELDTRTSNFFAKMMLQAITPTILAVPTLEMSFKIFGMVSGDANIGEKLVKGIALPHVQKLITTLDKISPSIVDDIIKPPSKENTPPILHQLKSVFSSLLNWLRQISYTIFNHLRSLCKER